MKRAPDKWKKKVKKDLKKKIGMSDRSADVTISAIWNDGMKDKCRKNIIKKYGKTDHKRK